MVWGLLGFGLVWLGASSYQFADVLSDTDLVYGLRLPDGTASQHADLPEGEEEAWPVPSRPQFFDGAHVVGVDADSQPGALTASGLGIRVVLWQPEATGEVNREVAGKVSVCFVHGMDQRIGTARPLV